MSTVYSTLKSGCVGLSQYQPKGAHTNLNPYLQQGVKDPCNRDTLSFNQKIDLMDVVRNVTEKLKDINSLNVALGPRDPSIHVEFVLRM